MKRTVLLGLVVVSLAVTAGAVVSAGQFAKRYRPVRLVAGTLPAPSLVEPALAKVLPKPPFVVVDTNHNRLAVVAVDGSIDVLAPCSTGSGTTLRDPETGKTWVFNTPLGAHKVRRKVKNPVWVKPDWAFIEEGERPPSRRSDRYDDVSLGDYALYMDDGYLIHGTLFQTLLGRGVTHGCIRLGDTDLEMVFRSVPVGSWVLIF